MKYKKTIISLLLIILSILVLYNLFNIGQYFYLRYKAKLYSDECIQKYIKFGRDHNREYKIDKNYYLIYHLVLPELLLYKVKYKNKPLTFITQNLPRHFIIPEEIINDSDYIFGYGIDKKMYWEEMISKYYKKPTYAFDCGVRYKDSDIKSEYLTFCSECIGTDAFIFSDQISSGKIHTLKSKINELGIQDKKIYLRFEIPQLQKIIPEVIENKDNITGITIIRDYWSPLDIIETLELLKLLNKDFALVSRNFLYARDKKLKDGKLKYTDGSWSIMVELTYVNKNILDEYYIPLDQSNYKNGKPSSYISMHLKSYKQDRKLKNVSKNKGSAGYYKYNNISPIVVIHKKISRKLQEIK